MSKKKIGEFDFAQIVNTIMQPVNEALVDGKNNKSNNKKNSSKATLKVDIVKGDSSDIESAIAKATKPQETPVTLVADASKANKERKEAGKPIDTTVKYHTDASEVDKTNNKIAKPKTAKYKEIPLMGNVNVTKANQDAISSVTGYMNLLNKTIEKATEYNAKKLLQHVDVKDFMAQNPGLIDRTNLDTKVKGAVTRFVNSNNITDEEFIGRISEQFRIGNIIRKIEQAYNGKTGIFEEKEIDSLSTLLEQRQQQATLLAYHDKLVGDFKSNNTKEYLGGATVKHEGYFVDKTSDLLTPFKEKLTEEVSAIGHVEEIKTALETGGDGIVAAFDSAAKDIGAGSKGLTAALKQVKTDLIEQKKKSIEKNTKTEVEKAVDKINGIIEKGDVENSRDRLQRLPREQKDVQGDLSTTVQGAIIGHYLNYKFRYKDKNPLDEKLLEVYEDVIKIALEQDVTGKFREAYDAQVAKLTQEQKELEEKAATAKETPAIEKKPTTSRKRTTSKKNSSSQSNSSSDRRKSSKKSPEIAERQSEPKSIYDSVVNADYSAKNRDDAEKKFKAAVSNLDALREDMERNPEIPRNNLAETSAMYKARKYYITALQHGITPEELNPYSPFEKNNVGLEEAKGGLKGLEQRLSIFSEIYSKISDFSANLLGNKTIMNAADRLANQIFSQRSKKSKNKLTVKDLDKTSNLEAALIGKIHDISNKNTDGLTFVKDQKALYDELEGYTSETPTAKNTDSQSASHTSSKYSRPPKIKNNSHVRNTAGEILVYNGNEWVISEAENTGAKNFKVVNAPKLKSTPITEELTTLPKSPRIKGNSQAKDSNGENVIWDGQNWVLPIEESKYKVTSAPKLKVSKDTAQSKSDREEQKARIIQAKKNAQAAENEQSFITHKSGNLLGSTYNGFKLSPEKLLGFLEQDNPYKNYRLVSNNEDINGRKKTTVYKDDQTGRSYTRTLTKDSDGLWRQSGGNIKSGYAALEKEAIDTEKKLMTEREDLADMEAGIAKNSSQSSIEASKKRIGYLKGRMRSLRTDAETYAQEYPEYTTKQFNEAIQKGIEKYQIDMNERAGNRSEKVAARQEADRVQGVVDNYNAIVDATNSIHLANKNELAKMKEQETYTSGTDGYNEVAGQIAKITQQRKDAQKSIIDIVGDKGVAGFIEENKKTLEEAGQDLSKLSNAQSQVTDSERNLTDYINQSDISDRYKTATEDVVALQKAQDKLFEAQRNHGNNPTEDTTKEVESARVEYQKLNASVQDFRDNTYEAEKEQKELTNNKQFNAYNKAYDDTVKNAENNQKSLTSMLSGAYKDREKMEDKLFKSLSSSKASQTDIEGYANQYELHQRRISAIEQQIKQSYGEEYLKQAQEAATKNVASPFVRQENMTQGIDSVSKSFNTYVEGIQNANKATEDFTSRQQVVADKISALKTNFENGNVSITDYAKEMQSINQEFSELQDYMKNGAGKSGSEFQELFNTLQKATNSSNKISAYGQALQSFQDKFDTLNADLKNGDINTKTYNKGISDLISNMKDFQKISGNLDSVNSKGKLVENSIGTIQDINDATVKLKEYATQMGYTNETARSFNESTGKVNMSFTDASGNIIKMTGVIEDLGNGIKGLRVSQSVLSQTSTGFKSLSDSVKGLVKGNFTSALGDIASAVGNIQIMYKAMDQMRKGLTTFMDYDKALTTISYTMDMNKQQLSSLGSSAVDMAKDLSMSLDNTMDIYQIYANMNTTSKEIQETAKPTAILSNLSGVDTSTAADQVQGILQQFHMLEDGSTSAADASMHVVDVLDKISANVGIDYAKGIKVMSDAVQASGQVAYDAGMSYEQLAAISAKVAERTREDGSSIGNAIKTIITRTTKVGKMPQYSDEVSNEDLSNASASLHAVGVDVYNPDGSDRGIITVLSELKSKWNDLTDAQQAKIAFDVAATRQTSKFKSMLDAFTDSMSLAEEATNAQGNAEANQEKYMESFNGKVQAIKTQMDEFWLNFYNSDQVGGVLDFVHGLTEGFTGLEKTLGPIPALITAIFSAMTVKNATMKGLRFLSNGGLGTAVG